MFAAMVKVVGKCMGNNRSLHTFIGFKGVRVRELVKSLNTSQLAQFLLGLFD